MKTKTILVLLVLLAFGAYSAGVVWQHGYFGFLALLSEPWGPQVLIDLALAVFFFTAWMIPDAQRRGISPWPYLGLCVALGSLGALGYLLHRGLRPLPAGAES
ncbi:MAG: DUF2834 domain-containing protein [Deltaproteobacteria bacterium]|jgi:hypothetical protein|nr:DUF2834 domain-containing protein [Deltaproteobacteria bacterium]